MRHHELKLYPKPGEDCKCLFGEKQILPLIRKYKVLHLNRTDARLANNGLPVEIQKLRCRVNYNALRFTPEIENLGRRLVQALRRNGPFVVLHLRYEMDMLAFSGCTHGCSKKEAEELTKMRHSASIAVIKFTLRQVKYMVDKEEWLPLPLLIPMWLEKRHYYLHISVFSRTILPRWQH